MGLEDGSSGTLEDALGVDESAMMLVVVVVC